MSLQMPQRRKPFATLMSIEWYYPGQGWKKSGPLIHNLELQKTSTMLNVSLKNKMQREEASYLTSLEYLKSCLKVIQADQNMLNS
jgi:hypothetical protein